MKPLKSIQNTLPSLEYLNLRDYILKTISQQKYFNSEKTKIRFFSDYFLYPKVQQTASDKINNN